MRIGASGVWVGIASAVILLIVAGGLVWFGGFAPLYAIGTAGAAAAVTVHTLIVRRHDGVTCEDSGLVVTVRGRRTVHPWSGLLEVGWAGHTQPCYGAGLLLRPVAGGPGTPRDRTAPPRSRPWRCSAGGARSHARTVLREQCTVHHVPFAGNGRRMLNDGSPGSPYRGRS